MTDFLRDALLAAASGLLLVLALVLSDSLPMLGDPTAAAAGIGAALAVETAFIADTPAAALWERPLARRLSVAGLLAGAVALAWLTGPWILAAACWGVATYFALLALVLGARWSCTR